MVIHFKSTHRNANTHCCICGQGFELRWDKRPRSERAAFLFVIQKALCNHHRDQNGPQAHPQDGVFSLEPEESRLIPGAGELTLVETGLVQG